MARQNSRNNSMYSQRKVSGRSKVKTFLILCEGEKTEQNYFEGFQKIARANKTAYITIKGLGAVGITVVTIAKQLKEQGNYGDDEVWCVFDRDLKYENNNQQNFNAAIRLAIENQLNLAVSNDAFELWFLLHYEYYQSETHRSEYEKMLSIRLGEKYEKNSETMYEKLKDKESNAINFAKKLWLNHCNLHGIDDPNPDKLTVKQRIIIHNINPSTTVYQLVEKLNEVIFTKPQ